MAVTATVTVDNGGELGSGNDQYAYGQIAISSTYVTGGFAVDLPAGGYDMSNIRYLRASGGGYICDWDPAGQLLKLFNPTAAHTHTENTAGSYTQNATTSANAVAVATEVANGATVSGTLNFFAVGE
jgi:hypothetical protein